MVPDLLPDNAYTLGIGSRCSTKISGTFGCFVRLRFSESDNLKTMALTCHHIVLLSISIHPKVKEWEIYIIRPPEETNLTMDMPSRLDHLETVASYNEGIKKDHTAAHSIIRMRLRDPQDFITYLERRAIYERTETGTTRSGRFSYSYGPNIYEMTETAIFTTKDTPRKAEESFKRSKGTFWPFVCSIRPPATIPTCYSTSIL